MEAGARMGNDFRKVLDYICIYAVVEELGAAGRVIGNGPLPPCRVTRPCLSSRKALDDHTTAQRCSTRRHDMHDGTERILGNARDMYQYE